MAEKVKLSKDGSSIDFVQSESIPTSLKKFRQSPEIEGFYRFIFENDLQKEAYDIMNRIINERKAKKSELKKEAAIAKKEAAKAEAQANKPATKADSKKVSQLTTKPTPSVKAEVKKATPAKTAPKAAAKSKPAAKAPAKKTTGKKGK